MSVFTRLTAVTHLDIELPAFIDGCNDRSHPFLWTKAGPYYAGGEGVCRRRRTQPAPDQVLDAVRRVHHGYDGDSW